MSNQNNTDDKNENKEPGTALEQRQGTNMGFTLEPRNLKEALKICEYLASSKLVPKQYQGNPEDILVCINWGMEVGLKPLQALSNIAVINGNPSMWGAAPLALVRNSPEFEFILEDNEGFAYARDNVKGWEHLKNVSPNDTSICVVKRKNEPPLVREFSKDDVKMAGLGNVHKNYPKDMRKYRARSRALEAAFGDVLKGMRQAELEKENHQMIEEGHWEDVTINKDPEPEQKTEGRQPIDTNNGEPKKERVDEETPLLDEVMELGKKAHGGDWYKESKVIADNISDGRASFINELNEDELKKAKKILEMGVAEEEG